MNIKELEQMLDEQTKRKQRGAKAGGGYDVSFAVCKTCFAISIYKEPTKYSFSDSDYWQPVFHEKTKRLYVVCAGAYGGYKVQKKSAGIGRIQFNNKLLADYMATKEADHPREIYANWGWDDECSKAYIQFD